MQAEVGEFEDVGLYRRAVLCFDNMEYMNGCGQDGVSGCTPDIVPLVRVAKQQRPILQRQDGRRFAHLHCGGAG